MLFPSPLLPLSPLATPEDSFLMALLNERKTDHLFPPSIVMLVGS